MEIAYALYRVSTAKQVDKIKDDIPMQREACHGFAEQMGWKIEKEFLEKGVSGFKVSANNRDAIQKLKTAALNGEFQILLVYMFDRIGRIDDETPFVVEWFAKHGIRVWSVQEGEQKFESHVDKLMNYIRFWQASGESEKTSMRIKTRMQQLTAEGAYTGGSVPFGYRLEKRGRLNKRGKEVSNLAVELDEAEWIRKIFELTVKDGYGSYRIAEHLNEHGQRTHGGAKFQSITIIRILKNRLYCGYVVSGEATSPQMKELQIVDENLFLQAQMILQQRERKNNAQRQIALSTKGKTLLSGIMFCTHCGGRLTANKFKNKYTLADGTERCAEYVKYICYHNSRKLCKCDGQATYTADKVDRAVLAAISEILSYISEPPDEAILNKKYQKEMAGVRAKHTKLNLELSRAETQLEKLNDEIGRSLTGESPYTPEQLSAAIDSTNRRMSDTKLSLENLENDMNEKKTAFEKIKPTYDRFVSWAVEFDCASIERKKMVISQIVDRIEIGKGYKIRLVLNMEYRQFCEGWEKLNQGNEVVI